MQVHSMTSHVSCAMPRWGATRRGFLLNKQTGFGGRFRYSLHGGPTDFVNR